MAVNINIPSEVTQTITDGVTTTAPSENAVFDALSLKANTADLADVATTGDYDDLINKPTITSGTVTSVDLTMPAAFAVTGNPVTSSGTLAVAAAGLSSQYIRGDGQLANFPTSSGGGSSVNFYLNGSVAQGTLGGVAFKQMSSTPVIGTGTDFTINADGYIQSFITDASVPNQLSIPGGNWNFEMYFSASSSGNTPRFYIELYKLSGGTLTLLASNSATPEFITNGIAIDLYTTALAVPSTVLLAADRLAVRVYVIHSSKTITLHTENSHLCQVITTFSTGLTALNGLTSQMQNLAVGTSGIDFTISSVTDTHTFNLPTASATNRGALSTSDWSAFNGKQAALISGTNIKTINGTSVLGSGDLTISGGGITVGTTGVTSGTVGRVFFQATGDVVQQSASLFWDNTNGRLNLGAVASNTARLDIKAPGALSTSIAFRVRNSIDSQNLMSIAGDGRISIGLNAQILGTTDAFKNVVIGGGAKDIPTAGVTENAVALGYNAVSNNSGTAIGANSSITGVEGTAIGAFAIAGLNSTAIGKSARADGTSGYQSLAIGYGARASALLSGIIAVGQASYTNALGQTLAFCVDPSGPNSQTMLLTNKANLVFRNSTQLTSGTHWNVAATNTITIHNGTIPDTTIANAGQLYVEGGALKFRGGSGTITVVAPA